ncbi:MAG: hypothetical protein ABIG88_00335 [Patescibacteria group bacterium]
MWKTIINLLFPIYCLGCRQEGKFICSSCFEKIKMNEKYYFDKADILKKTLVVGCNDDELLKQMIYRYKYNFIKDLSKPLGQLMINKLIKDIKKNNLKKIILIPIPLHPKRLRWRGFNQAELLAEEISKELNIPVINNLLIRTKNNLPQAKIQKAFQRRQNVYNVFDLRGRASKATSLTLGGRKGVLERHGLDNDFKNKTLILVDDISTTSATLKEAARTLNILKPKQIWGLVLIKD